jgi:DNA-binding transcriptional MerR regulator
MARTLTIGQVARAAGVTAKAIRYYEQIGVLPAPSRTASGYRQYEEAAVERLRFVSRARALGLPLRRLRILTGALNGRSSAPLRPRLLAVVQQHLGVVRHRIAELEMLQRQLEEVSHRMQASPPSRASGACRCLETGTSSPQPARRSTGRLRRS